MRFEKKRLSLYVPAIIYDRLYTDSEIYGVSKTSIVLNALVAYYREIDSERHTKPFNTSSDKLMPQSFKGSVTFSGSCTAAMCQVVVEYRNSL